MLRGVGLLADRNVPGTQYVGPGLLLSPFTSTRDQPGASRSTALGSNGSTWQESGPDIPRFNGSARQLLGEGQRANGFVNPRCEGAAIGSPGIMPLQWRDAVPAGVTRTVVGTGVEFGLPYIEVRFQTAGATASEPVEFQPTHVSSSPSQTWTCSVFHRLTAGSMTNASLFLRIYEFGGTGFPNTVQPFVPTNSFARVTVTHAMVDPASFVVNGRVLMETSGPVDLTMRLYAPQMELGSFASTPVLPPAGTPSASTRGTDIVTASLSSLGLGNNGAGTYLWRGAVPSPVGNMRIMTVSDGTLSNYYGIMLSGTTFFPILNTSSLLNTGASSAVAAGVPFRAGFTLDGNGRIASSMNGGPIAQIVGGATAGLLRLDLGSILSAEPMFGETSAMRIIPEVVSDATLQSLVAGFSM